MIISIKPNLRRRKVGIYGGRFFIIILRSPYTLNYHIIIRRMRGFK